MESELSIRVIGTSGKEGKGESQFAQPRGVCIDPRTKELFVVDCNNHRIQVFHLSSLAFIRQIGKGVQGSSPGSLNYAVGICMDDVNQIFVADTNNHRVSVFNHITGGFIRLISSHGSANGYLSSPYGVCVDIYSGMLYVADYDNHRVQVFDKETGDFVRIIGSGFGSAPGQMNQPIVVAIDGETNYLFVADYSNNRVQVFDKDSGVYICSIGNEPGPNCLHGPRGLCINKESNLLFVSDRENHRIQVFDKNTLLFIRHLGQGVGTLLGQFNRPMELCANTEEGVLIAVDGYNHRVQIMELPELVFERQKYRAAMKAKVEAEMKSGSTPRPSLLAVSTDLLTQSVLEIQSESGEGILKFPQYSSVYEMVLNKSDVELLKAYFEANDFANKIKLHASRLNRVSKAEESDSTTHDRKVEMLKKQADTYITILKELAISSKNEDFSMVVPALCALHSTIERNYTPEYMPHEVIELLIDFIANLDDGINSEDERPRVIDAIVALMRQSLSIGKDVEETVLSATLSGLSRPIRYSTEKNGVYESECSDAFGKSDNFDVLLAYYNILADIHTYQKRNSCAKLGEKQMVTGHSNLLYLRDPIDKDRLLSPLSIEKRRQVLCSQVLNFVFGYKFVSKLDKIRTSRVRGVGQPLKFAKITLPVSNTGDFMAGTNGNSVNETTDQSNLKGDSLIIVPDNQSVLLDIVYRINSHRGASSVHNPIILDLQLQLFDEAIKYFANVALNSGDNVVSSSSLPRTSRGGRNIWRPDEPLAVGDLVDAMDKEKSWFESIIQEVYPDNSIKVHFMGWGAKWDDVITNTEISSRLAPLNSKTKNWREDLFEGGLIEIKCNDDLVNQKWMWGKITKLNREEAWVEVSYSFSNEPLVVKRAWLFGETICPVGMHTKDKSKGAAALLVKPHKKAEDIIREKSEETMHQNEGLFFDIEDFFEEDFLAGGGVKSGIESREKSYGGGILLNLGLKLEQLVSNICNFTRSRPPSLTDRDPIEPIALISFNLFESVMRELIHVIVEDPSECITTASAIVKEKVLNTAKSLIQYISGTSYKGLLAPYFVRVIIFQCGIKAKIISSSFLKDFRENLNDISKNFEPVMLILDLFKQLTEKYSSIVLSCLGNQLSPGTINHIIARLHASVNRCGGTQIANDLIAFISNHSTIKFEMFEKFLSGDRFTEKSIQLRKILSYLFQSASRKEAAKFQVLFEEALNGWISSELNKLPFNPSPALENSKWNYEDWAINLVQSIILIYEKAQSVSRIEMVHSNLCNLSAERSFEREFSAFSGIKGNGCAQAFAICIHTLVKSRNNDGNQLSFFDQVVQFLKIISSEEIEYTFKKYYEVLLSHRLLKRDTLSVTTEKAVLELLPIMPKAQQMIHEAEQTPVYTREFTKYLMNRVDDDDEIEITPLINLALQSKNGLSITILSSTNWPCISTSVPYGTLRVTKDMQHLADEFCDFYASYNMNVSLAIPPMSRIPTGIPITSNRKLNWCFGLGSMILNCISKIGAVEIEVSEPQAMLLLQFSGEGKAKTVGELMLSLNLSFEATRAVVESLERREFPLVVSNQAVSGGLQLQSSVQIASEFINNVENANGNNPLYSKSVSQVNNSHYSCCYEFMDRDDAHALTDWRKQQIDCSVVKVLKAEGREVNSFTGATKSSVPQGEVVELVLKELHSRLINSLFSTEEILPRLQYLVSSGIIHSIPTEKTALQSVAYSYFSPIKKDKIISADNQSIVQYSDSSRLYTGKELLEYLKKTIYTSTSEDNKSCSLEEEKSTSECNDNLDSDNFCALFFSWIWSLHHPTIFIDDHLNSSHFEGSQAFSSVNRIPLDSASFPPVGGLATGIDRIGNDQDRKKYKDQSPINMIGQSIMLRDRMLTCLITLICQLNKLIQQHSTRPEVLMSRGPPSVQFIMSAIQHIRSCHLLVNEVCSSFNKRILLALPVATIKFVVMKFSVLIKLESTPNGTDGISIGRLLSKIADTSLRSSVVCDIEKLWDWPCSVNLLNTNTSSHFSPAMQLYLLQELCFSNSKTNVRSNIERSAFPEKTGEMKSFDQTRSEEDSPIDENLVISFNQFLKLVLDFGEVDSVEKSEVLPAVQISNENFDHSFHSQPAAFLTPFQRVTTLSRDKSSAKFEKRRIKLRSSRIQSAEAVSDGSNTTAGKRPLWSINSPSTSLFNQQEFNSTSNPSTVFGESVESRFIDNDSVSEKQVSDSLNISASARLFSERPLDDECESKSTSIMVDGKENGMFESESINYFPSATPSIPLFLDSGSASFQKTSSQQSTQDNMKEIQVHHQSLANSDSTNDILRKFRYNFAIKLRQLQIWTDKAIKWSDFVGDEDAIESNINKRLTGMSALGYDICSDLFQILADSNGWKSPDCDPCALLHWLHDTSLNSMQHVVLRAFNLMDYNSDGVLGEDDFHFSECYKKYDTKFEAALNSIAPSSLSDTVVTETIRPISAKDSYGRLLSLHLICGPQTAALGGSFFRVTQQIATALGLSWLTCMKLLKRYNWNHYLLIENLETISNVYDRHSFINATEMNSLVNSVGDTERSKGNSGNQNGLLLCSSCQKDCKVTQLYALRCRHWACRDCWCRHIQNYIDRHGTERTISCIRNTQRRGGMHLPGCQCSATVTTEFVAELCHQEDLLKYLRPLIREYEESYECCTKGATSAKNQLIDLSCFQLLNNLYNSTIATNNFVEKGNCSLSSHKSTSMVDNKSANSDTNTSSSTKIVTNTVNSFIISTSALIGGVSSEFTPPILSSSKKYSVLNENIENYSQQLKIQQRICGLVDLIKHNQIVSHYWLQKKQLRIWKLFLAVDYIICHFKTVSTQSISLIRGGNGNGATIVISGKSFATKNSNQGTGNFPYNSDDNYVLIDLLTEWRNYFLTNVKSLLDGNMDRLKALENTITKVVIRVFDTVKMKDSLQINNSVSQASSLAKLSLTNDCKSQLGKLELEQSLPIDRKRSTSVGFGYAPYIEDCEVITHDNTSVLSLKESSNFADVVDESMAMKRLLAIHENLLHPNFLECVDSLVVKNLLDLMEKYMESTTIFLYCSIIINTILRTCKSQAANSECYHTYNNVAKSEIGSILTRISCSNTTWKIISTGLTKHAWNSTIVSNLCNIISTMAIDHNRTEYLTSYHSNNILLAFKKIIRIYMNDGILKSIVSAITSGLDSNFTAEHHFLSDGTCETFIKLMIKYFAVYDSMKKELLVSVGRLSKNNHYMQLKLVEWGVIKPLIEILRCDYKDTELIKSLCWCLCCVMLDNPDGQLKFTALNGFKVVGLVLKVTEDLSTLRSILKMIAPLVHNNITAQAQCYQENIVTILCETRSELQHIDSETLTIDAKSVVKITLLTVEYALDHIQVHDNSSDGSSNRTVAQGVNSDGDEPALHNDLADGHHNMNMVEVLHQRMLARRNAVDNNPNHNQVRQTLDLLGLPPDVADRAAIRLMRAAVRHQENINQNNTD